MRRNEPGWYWGVRLGLVLMAGACFGGDFVLGLPCQSDEDCGPTLACVGGLCGGPGDLALCGNRLLDEGEQCDDGNTQDGDECTPECLLAVCGDGFLAPGEACDDGNTVDGDGCSVECQRTDLCGNGIVELSEQCDDGNLEDGDECTPACQFPRCGDGYVAPGEECDGSMGCTPMCQKSLCGDGFTAVDEECDDGNTADRDFCTPTCSFPVCGDGFLAAGEECDDGNDDALDGCAEDCFEVKSALDLVFSPIKQFEFGWESVTGIEYYQLFEQADAGDEFVQIGDERISGESASFTMPLYLRANARYGLHACVGMRCMELAAMDVVGDLTESVGYLKAPNVGEEDFFGNSVSLSDDGSILAVGARLEDSGATGIGGISDDNNSVNSGAVYVFVRSEEGHWSQQAYIKAFNAESGDSFGSGVVLSGDGSTLAVGARGEDSSATGINGVDDNEAEDSGAVYVFVRGKTNRWYQQAYIKASNTGARDEFGWRNLALRYDGDVLAVGAPFEDGDAGSIDGAYNDEAAGSGAVYVFGRDARGQWSQQAYVKASNARVGDNLGRSVALSSTGAILAVGADGKDEDAGAVYVFERDAQGSWAQQEYVQASNVEADDHFGQSVALSSNGRTLAVGAHREDSSATGINDNLYDNDMTSAGAAYVFLRDPMGQWVEEAYVKASNPGEGDFFGTRVVLSDDGAILAVGAYGESSGSPGINGDQGDSEEGAGAVYVFVRDDVELWKQHAYVKASNINDNDNFGRALALSGDGNTLAVGAQGEDGGFTSPGESPNNLVTNSGAVYLY